MEYLLFTALIYEVGPQLESIRTPTSSEQVFSWRFDPASDGQMYDPDYRWSDFNTRCQRLASTGRCRWVVIADIADFFPHIYLHPVESALEAATNRSPAAYCVLRMIRNWNAFVSYGLPVGLAGSRIIAEATISDLDRALQGAGRPYCRYSDDIRIFCRSESDATQALEQLASHLFNTHGLTLQPAKTLILRKQEFIARFTKTGERAELESLAGKLHSLLAAAGWEDDYEEEIDFEDLPAETQSEIEHLNLVNVLQEQISAGTLDPLVTSFVLHRMKQLGVEDGFTLVLDNLEKLFPVVDSAVRYLESLRDANRTAARRIGRSVLSAARRGATGSYERMCLLSLFTKGREFDNDQRFEAMYEAVADGGTRRELLLALGRARKSHWFQARRQSVTELDPWSRRAFLAGYSCLPLDVRSHFYRSLRGGVDVLEKSVIKWADANPF